MYILYFIYWVRSIIVYCLVFIVMNISNQFFLININFFIIFVFINKVLYRVIYFKFIFIFDFQKMFMDVVKKNILS